MKNQAFLRLSQVNCQIAKEGTGIDKNFETAVNLLGLVVNKPVFRAKALGALSQIYYEGGSGITRDMVKAYAYLILYNYTGMDKRKFKASQALFKLRMSKRDIIAAQKYAREYSKEIGLQ